MKKIIAALSLLTIIFISCSKDDSGEPKILSNENLITSFSLTIDNKVYMGDIDQINKTITFNVVGKDLKSLTPTVIYSKKAKLLPSAGVVQNFNNEIVYNVIAENGDSNAYRIIVNNRPLSSENKILTFSVVINNQTILADIDHNKKLITINTGTFDKTALTPKVTISPNATISPNVNSSINLSDAILISVTAENGDITSYKVIANPSKIEQITTISGVYTNNPMLLYVGADLSIYGDFLDINRTNAKLYLTDGTNNFPLPIIKSSNYNNGDYLVKYNLTTKIPKNIPTYAKYKIIFEYKDSKTESETYIDILAENAPNPISLNKSVYNFNDVLIINGDNLKEIISIPSSGSYYLIQNPYYDINLNSDKSELRVTLSNYQLFPSYFGLPEEEKIISILDNNRRVGATIKAVLK